MTSDDSFQRRAGEEGRQVQAMAKKVLQGCGFNDLKKNTRRPELGVTINFLGLDSADREWCFDVSGAFTSQRAGLIRTDTMWKTLGRANVLHQAGVERLVLLTTNLPKPGSAGHRALTAASQTFFDAIEMLTSEGKARLTLYAQGARDRPLPGLRAPSQLYRQLSSRTVGTDLQVRVPLVDVASAMPARVTADVHVMPNRLKVFLPSRSAAGTLLDQATRHAAGERIRGLLNGFAGGCTLAPSIGSWLDPIGGEMLEDVILIESYAQAPFPDQLVADVVQVLVEDLGQHTAALILNDAMIHVTPRPHA